MIAVFGFGKAPYGWVGGAPIGGYCPDPVGITWPLVGRSVALEGVLAAVSDTAVRAVLVTGPAGIGKTRLLGELAGSAEDAGHDVVRVRATASAATVPLAAVQDLLPAEAGHASHRELLAAAVSALRRRYGAASRRLLVAVDDAHLLDDASATLVHALCADGGPLVVAAVRTGEPAPDAVAALWKDFDAEVVELQPLSGAEVAALMAGALGGPVEGRSARRIAVTSGGNPLLVRELVRAAQATGGLTVDPDGLWRLPESLPISGRLDEIVAARVGTLGQAARQALDTVALAGPLPLDLLVGVTDRHAVSAAEAAGLLTIASDGRRRTAEIGHPLFGEVLRAGLPWMRAQDLYVRLAAALVATGPRRRGDLALLARWQLAAGQVPDREALVDAAVSAYQQGDHPLTLELAALAEPDGGRADPGVEHRLAAACAGAALWLGRTEESDRWFGRAVAAAPPAARGSLLLGRAYNLFLGAGRVSAAAEVLAAARREGAPASAVAALEALFFVSSGRIAEALSTCAAAPADERSVAAARVSALTWAGRTEEAVASAASAERLDPVSGAPGEALDATACTALALSGRLGAAEGRARRGYLTALDQPDLGRRALWAFALGQLLLWWGRPAEAAPLLSEAATTMAGRPTGLGPAAHLHCLGNLAEARALLGDVAGAERALAAVELVPVGDCAAPALETGRAWTSAARGDRGQALALLRCTAESSARLGNRIAAARALLDMVRLGDVAVAEKLRDAAGGLQGALAGAWMTFAAAACRPDDEAPAELERLGLCLLSAEAGIRSGSRAAARGRRLLDDLDVKAPWLDGAAGLPVALTRREVEIARLAAGGRSSREVAAALHLSVRTVDSHLGHAYRKLGVHTRVELAAALRDVVG